jgi:hypothetical protein
MKKNNSVKLSDEKSTLAQNPREYAEWRLKVYRELIFCLDK